MKVVKIINDPVFGFINIPKGLLYDVLTHPVMQRLTRIRQLGLSSFVYPGAQHTRFQHSVGAYHLMSEAVAALRAKGVEISDEEAEAVEAAILLHDVGHGPFSHVLEHTLVSDIDHEEISLLLMEMIDRELNGRLALAIRIYRDEYHKRFFHQLVSSQLDMDRLDYLRRDSFYTGVIEGSIGSARIIKMLNVENDHLAVDSKGIYSIENFLTARRLMYWQVYMHKTAVAAEKMLVTALSRAKKLASEGVELFASPALHYFLYNHVTGDTFFHDPECLRQFIRLDDNDIWCSMKVWCDCPDTVLSTLARGLTDRRLFKIEISEEPFTEDYVNDIRTRIATSLGISYEEAGSLVFCSAMSKDMYNAEDEKITILYRDGRACDIAEASDMFNHSMLEKKVKKYYICYHRV